MKKRFKKEGGETVDPVKHTIEVLSKNDNVKIYVGTDSQNSKKFTTYVTCVCYRYGNKGAHYIYFRESIKKIKDRWTRLWGEVERSVEIAKLIQENSIKVFCVDLDFNEKELARSHDMVAAARGYVVGLGFDCTVKPEEQVATRSADHICRR